MVCGASRNNPAPVEYKVTYVMNGTSQRKTGTFGNYEDARLNILAAAGTTMLFEVRPVGDKAWKTARATVPANLVEKEAEAYSNPPPASPPAIVTPPPPPPIINVKPPTPPPIIEKPVKEVPPPTPPPPPQPEPTPPKIPVPGQNDLGEGSGLGVNREQGYYVTVPGETVDKKPASAGDVVVKGALPADIKDPAPDAPRGMNTTPEFMRDEVVSDVSVLEEGQAGAAHMMRNRDILIEPEYYAPPASKGVTVTGAVVVVSFLTLIFLIR